MTTPQEEVFSVEVDIDHDIKLGEALQRLQKHPDFKTVITEGYLDGKVKASVSLLAVPAIKARGARTDVMEDLISASNLQYYFLMIEQKYEGAKAPVLSDEEEAELEAQEQVVN